MTEGRPWAVIVEVRDDNREQRYFVGSRHRWRWLAMIARDKWDRHIGEGVRSATVIHSAAPVSLWKPFTDTALKEAE